MAKKYKARKLSSRQQKFIRLFLAGKSIRQAAVSAGYSQRTADRGAAGLIVLQRLRQLSARAQTGRLAHAGSSTTS